VQISMLLSNTRRRRTASVAVGTLGWLGLCFCGMVLLIGGPGPALLISALLGLGLLSVGGWLWNRSGDRATLNIYVGATFVAAVGLVALVEVSSIVVSHVRR